MKKLYTATILTSNVDILNKGLMAFCSSHASLTPITSVAPFLSWVCGNDSIENIKNILALLGAVSENNKEVGFITQTTVMHPRKMTRMITLTPATRKCALVISELIKKSGIVKMHFDYRKESDLSFINPIVDFIKEEHIKRCILNAHWI